MGARCGWEGTRTICWALIERTISIANRTPGRRMLWSCCLFAFVLIIFPMHAFRDCKNPGINSQDSEHATHLVVGYPFYVYDGQECLDYFSEKSSKPVGGENKRTMFRRIIIVDVNHIFIARIVRIDILNSATRWEVLEVHHPWMDWWWREKRISIGRGRCLNDNRFRKKVCNH